MKWEQVRLDNFCEITSSKRIFLSEYVKDGIPFYRSKEVIEKYNGQSISTELFISKNRYEQIKNQFGVPVVGDILLTSVGTLGIPMIVSDDRPFYFKDGNLTWFRNFDRSVNSYFLFQWLKSSIGVNTIKQSIIGSSQQALTISGLKQTKISLPPLPIQNTIAAILKAYDDLIENNLLRIKLLEQAAKCEYKLLMKESEVFTKKLQELGEVVTGKTPSMADKTFYGDDVPFVKTPDMHNQIVLLKTEQYLSSKGGDSQYKKYLPEGSIMVSCIGTAGIVAIAGIKCQTNQQINSIIPFKEFYSYFLYFNLRERREELEALGSNGSTFTNVNKSKFEAIEIQAPSDNDLQEFHCKVADTFKLIKTLLLQNTQLRQARDILLPKLLSGAIDVSKHQQATKLIPLPTPVISIVAEDVVEYEKYYRHTVLAAYFVNRLWKNNTFGHSKLMKLMYLAKHLKKIEFESNFMRGAAGPYDYNMLNAIDNLLQKNNWFLMYKKDEKYPKYKPINDNATFIQEFNIFFADRKKDIDDLIKKFGSRDSENVGMFTTIYESWRYLKSKGKKPTQPAIINEIWNCWNDEKRNISKERWIEHYNSMINEGWIA